MSAQPVQASDVGVVVLSFRPDSRLIDSLASVAASVPRPGRVLIVDNGSPPAELDRLVGAVPGVELHRLDTNLGYGGAMNIGAEQLSRAGCTRLLFVTQEVLLAPGMLATLLEHLDRNPRVGLVGPVLGVLSAPDIVWSAGGGLSALRHAPFHLAAGAALETVQASATQRVAWLDGACLLARTEAFTSVGGFRDDLFLYCEDVDIALKMRRQGWAVDCVRHAVALQESSSAPPYLDARNRALVLGARGTLGVVVDLLLRLVLDPLRGRGFRRVKLMMLGLADAARGRLDRSVALDYRS